jgi:hypothetical protein
VQVFLYSLINKQIGSCLLFYHSSLFWFELFYLSNLIFSFFFVIEKKFNVSIEQTRGISDYTQGLLENLLDESKRLENHAMRTDEIQMRSIAEFLKAYEVVKKRFYCTIYFFFGETSLLFFLGNI